MKQIELSLWQALKILWSFLWRSWVVIMPVVICVFIPASIILRRFGAESGGGKFFSMMLMIFVVWPVMMVISIAAQTFAMRWALKTKWSDFRLIAIAPPMGEPGPVVASAPPPSENL